ncbi:MAG TPA: glycosyltransferase family 39 protein [Candidatus Acidoferrales bacterium]|nr:glycosyltransferase family 39 protein [Candidatus Acidoferrales bacterium]
MGLLLVALVGLALRLFFIAQFPTVAGDTALYDQLARNWLDQHVYGLFIDGHLTPVDVRMPGYPAFLATIYALVGRTAVMFAQAVLDMGTCVLTGELAGKLAPPILRRRVATAGWWLAATCPWVANYSAVLLTEVLATFLIAAALVLLLGALAGRTRDWFFAGLLVGLGTLVRPETPLVLIAAAAVLIFRWRRPSEWSRLAAACALLAGGLLVPLAPWAARNWLTLHRVQFLAPRYVQLPDEFVPRGFYAWTNTWLVRYRDVSLVSWKLEDKPIAIEDLPSSAFDSAEERARVAVLLGPYNETTTMTPELDRKFGELARERAARHPMRTYLLIPLERAATIWFTPRVELLPYSGHIWPVARQWKEKPVNILVTIGFTLLNFFYVGLGVAGAWRAARRPNRASPSAPWALALLVAFLLVRTAFFTQVETPEPRYVLECFPALLALGALACAPQAASLTGVERE